MDGTKEIRAFLAQEIPATWFASPAEVTEDADEILVVGELAGDGPLDQGAQRFRSETREERMRIAKAAERRFGRKLSWGVRRGDTALLFTNLALPVMTRLRLGERQVLDTLIAAGVARSRSEALAWCVRLVGQHQSDWLAELRTALTAVEQARRRGPKARQLR